MGSSSLRGPSGGDRGAPVTGGRGRFGYVGLLFNWLVPFCPLPPRVRVVVLHLVPGWTLHPSFPHPRPLVPRFRLV